MSDGELYGSGLGGGLDPHIPPVNVTKKYSPHLIAASINSTTPETTTIRSGIFEQFSEGVDTYLLLIHS